MNQIRKTTQKTRTARINITMPSGLLEEAKKLVDRRFFNGISDLIQHLVREAVEESPKKEQVGI